MLLSGTLSAQEPAPAKTDSVKISQDTTRQLSRDTAAKINGDITAQSSTDTSSGKDRTAKKIAAGFVSNSLNHRVDSIKRLLAFDSTQRKKMLRKLVPSTYGKISAGYDYGIIPFLTTTNFPVGYYSSQGNAGITLLSLPLKVSYYYSSLKNVVGLNNYYRVSFDPYAYRDNLQKNSLEKIDSEKARLTQLLSARQLMEQRLAFYENQLKEYPSQDYLNSKLQNYKSQWSGYHALPQDTLPDINKPNITKPDLADSLKNHTNYNPKSKLLLYGDSILQTSEKLRKYDSLLRTVEKYKAEYESIQKQVHAANNKIKYLENPKQVVDDNNPYQKKFQSFMSGIKALDVGLFYPNYSTFLMNGTAVKGVNFEWEKKFYFAFTYGRTINTLLTTNNIIQNQLQNARNLYNFFDFNNVRDSRKIMAVKFGIGAKESSHFYVGCLYGLGLPSYLNISSSPSIEKNIAVELDGRFLLNGSNSFDLVYGKSALYETGNPGDVTNSPSQSLFSAYRSNAAMLKYTSDIKKTQTRFSVTGRIVDPFFKSYGVGFIRSDNLRYEFKLDQQLGNKAKVSGFYRRDRDNLLNLMGVTNSLQTMGVNVSLKVNKRLTLRGIYSPVLQNQFFRDSSQKNSQHINTISNSIITYTPRAARVKSVFNFVYSYYQLSGSLNGSCYQNISINNTTAFSIPLKLDFAANYFYNNTPDTLNSRTLMVSGNVSYTGWKKSIVTLGVKYADNPVARNQLGGIARVNIPLAKYISFELQAERLVFGDFYSSYNRASLSKFPYYGYSKLIVTW